MKANRSLCSDNDDPWSDSELLAKKFCSVVATECRRIDFNESVQKILECFINGTYFDQHLDVKKIAVDIVSHADRVNIYAQTDEFNNMIVEVQKLVDALIIEDNNDQRGIYGNDIENSIRRFIIRFASMMNKDFDSKLQAQKIEFESKLQEINGRLVRLEQYNTLPDGLHILLNFVRLVRYYIKKKLVEQGKLESVKVTWEVAKSQAGGIEPINQIVEQYGISRGDWKELIRVTGRINNLKHGTICVEEARDVIDQLDDSPYSFLQPVFSRLLNTIERNVWVFPNEKLVD